MSYATSSSDNHGQTKKSADNGGHFDTEKLQEKAGDYVDKLKSQMGDLKDQAKEQVDQWTDDLTKYIKGCPIKSVTVAAVAGLFLGLLLKK